MEPGKVIWLDEGLDTTWDLPRVSAPLRVVVHRATGGLLVHGAQLFVNAIGFDREWFLRLGFLQPEGLAEVLRAIDPSSSLDSALAVELPARAGDASLFHKINALRHLHLPMFAGDAQPPGFGNLLNLGGLAERIMGRYF
jgi:hypothetical protein